MNQCEQLKKELEDIKSLKTEFDLAFQKTKETGETKELQRAKELRKEIEEKMASLREKLAPKEIKGTWENPETGEKREIILNIEKEIQSFKEFYKTHLSLELTSEHEKEINDIWRKNHKEIKQEMERYGYDTILIIPENLPDCEKLNEKLIETMVEPTKGKVAKTWQSDNFKEGGGFKGVKNTEKPKTRIILTKNVQNSYKSGDPIIEATLDKNIPQLLFNISKEEWDNLDEEEQEAKSKKAFDSLQKGAGMNFEADINGKKIKIQAEGLSLNEYLVFQRSYFEKNQKHLDESGGTWLLKSASGLRLADSRWGPVRRRLYVVADVPGYSGVSLGARPCRSFSGLP